MTSSVLKRPLVSEKSSLLLEGNKFTFLIEKDVTKIDIKNYFKQNFEVKVEKVNIINVKPKKRRRGRIEGETKPKRKAIVTVLDEKNIDKIKQFF